MKPAITACAAAILTSVSLIACIGGSSTSALASQAGMGGGSHPTGTTPSHPSGFARGFARALAASGGVPTDISTDRWGPNNTVAFGNPTRRWGPSLVNKRPGYVANYSASNTLFTCPCVVAFDPFKPGVYGGVPIGNLGGTLSFPLVKELVYGLAVQMYADQHGDFGASGTSSTIGEIQVMGNVWGNHFDPGAPKFEGFILGPDHGVDPFNGGTNTFGTAR